MFGLYVIVTFCYVEYLSTTSSYFIFVLCFTTTCMVITRTFLYVYIYMLHDFPVYMIYDFTNINLSSSKKKEEHKRT